MYVETEFTKQMIMKETAPPYSHWKVMDSQNLRCMEVSGRH